MRISIAFVSVNVNNIDVQFVINNLQKSEYFDFVILKDISDKDKIAFHKEIQKAKNELKLRGVTIEDSHRLIINHIAKVKCSRQIDKIIVITQKNLPANYFSISNYSDITIISINDWNSYIGNIPVEVFLSKEIISNALLYSRNYKKQFQHHNETRGCIYDKCKRRSDLRASLWGDICGCCKSRLINSGVKLKQQEDALSLIRNCIKFNFDQKDTSMKIRPNPFLLDDKRYEIKQKQIFVAISWELVRTVYADLKQTLEAAGYKVVNAEDHLGQVVFKDIWRVMNESEMVLVDFSGKRPNVYLEFGMAIVLGKPVIAITQSKDDLPSDTPHIRWYLLNSTKVIQHQAIV